MKLQRWFWLPVLFVTAQSGQLAEQRDGSVAQRFVGAWRLVSWEERLPDGTTRPNRTIGPKGVGSLIYTDTGRMCGVLMNPDRPVWQFERSPADAEIRSAFDGFVAYCGTYEVNEAQGYVVHHVEMDKSPHIVGTDRRRSFVLSGNRLSLAFPSPPQSGVTQSTLVWDRVAK